MSKDVLKGPAPGGEKLFDKGLDFWRKVNKVTATAFAGAGVGLYLIGRPELGNVAFAAAAFDVAQNGLGKVIQNRRKRGAQPAAA